MKVMIQAAIVLLGVGLASAQIQDGGIASTNQGVAPGKEGLVLSLPNVGVDFKAPDTTAAAPRLGTPVSELDEMFRDPEGAPKGGSAAEAERWVTLALSGLVESKPKAEVVQAGGISIGGPLVNALHVSKSMELPKRLLHLVNPFAPMDETEEAPEVKGSNPQAWTALVGWNPGGSAFPDPRTHGPSLDLISVILSP